MSISNGGISFPHFSPIIIRKYSFFNSILIISNIVSESFHLF